MITVIMLKPSPQLMELMNMGMAYLTNVLKTSPEGRNRYLALNLMTHLDAATDMVMIIATRHASDVPRAAPSAPMGLNPKRP